MTKKFAEDFPHNPGYWGTSAFGSFSWKNTASVLYILGAIALLWMWALYRLRKRNLSPVYGARKVRPPSRLIQSNPQHQAELEKALSFLFTFAGISFLFGLNAPLLRIGGEFQWDLVIVFALFLLGGVGTWITSLELSIIRGGWFVLGFLLSTILIYLPTSVTGFLLLADILPNISPPYIYAFRIALQFSLGAIFVFTSYIIADMSGVRQVDVLKYTAAFVFLLIFAGFWIVSRSAIPSIIQTDLVQTLAFPIIVGAVLGLPKLALTRRENTPPLLVAAPNNLAIAPLVAGADWSPVAETMAYRDFALATPEGEAFHVRLFVRDSEEEIIYFAELPWYRALLDKQPDLIITDLVSALVILHRTGRTRSRQTRFQYRIRLIAGWIPWRVAARRNGGESPYTLSPGFPAYEPTREERSYLPHYRGSAIVPTGFSGVLAYTLQSRDMAAALLPEPHATLIELGRYSIEGIDNTLMNVNGFSRYLSPLYNLIPYVVLTRETEDQNCITKQNNVIQAICTGIDRLRQDIYVMDIVEAKKIADFLNWLPKQIYKFGDQKMDFDIPEISKALHNAEFKCRMPVFGGDPHFDIITERHLIEFMKELRLIQDLQLNKLAELDDLAKEIIWWQLKTPPDIPELGTSILKSSSGDTYLAPLLVVWIPNRPGKLRAVLSAIRELDLLFTSTVHVGEYGLIYLFPKDCLPPEAFTPLNGQAYQILQPGNLPDGLRYQIQESVHCENCVVREVQGLLLKIQDTRSGLLSALQVLQNDISQIDGNETNIEVAHVFPNEKGTGLCLMLMKEYDLRRAIMAFDRSLSMKKAPANDNHARTY